MFSPLVTAIVLSAVVKTRAVGQAAAGSVLVPPHNETDMPVNTRKKTAQENERARFGVNGAAAITRHQAKLPRRPVEDAKTSRAASPPRSTA